MRLARSLAWAGHTDQSIDLFEQAASRADGRREGGSGGARQKGQENDTGDEAGMR